MLAQRNRVPAQRVFRLLRGSGIHGFLPGDQVHLAVDHHAAFVGELHHHVRSQARTFVIHGMLLTLVVHALFQPRSAQYVVEHQLAPVAADLGIALQRIRQRRCLRRHVLVERLQFAHRTQQAGALPRFLAIQRIDAGAEIAQLVGERLEQPLDVRA